MKKIALSITSAALALTPSLAFAQSSFQGGYITSIINAVVAWLPRIIGILFSIGFIIFLWGVIMYVISGDAEKKEGAKKVMIYGIVGLAVMALAWGIVTLLGSIFNVNTGGTVQVPTINVQ